MSGPVTMASLPRRDAREQFALVGVASVFVEVVDDGFYAVDDKGGRCLMLPEEWARYRTLCERWSGTCHDMPGAAPRAHGRSAFARCFSEVEHLLQQYHLSFSEDEREDMVRLLGGKIEVLKTAVLRAEEIWQEERSTP